MKITHLGKLGEKKINMRILIIGGNGYIGSHLVESLKTHELLVISRNKPIKTTFNAHFINDQDNQIKNKINKFKPDIAINSSGFTTHQEDSESIEKLIDSNISYAVKMLNCLADSKLKLYINLGSSLEFYTNEDKPIPTNIYAASKTAFNPFLEYYSQVNNFKILTLYLNNIYGGNYNKKKIFDFIIDSTESSEPIDMTPGNQRLDFLHIEDLMELFQCIVNKPILDFEDNQKFLVGFGRDYSLKKLSILVSKIYKKDTKINWGGRKYRKREKMNSKSDNLDLLETFGWTPKITIEKGIEIYKKIKC
tara:strand:+ start:3920 stop:4840 length:921 start_codon:yes stop_codon:yes gene_type:complete